MTTLLIALGALIAGGGAVALTGYSYVRRQRAIHNHIWAPWEDCKITNPIGSVAGQKRECLDCGLKEIRNVL